VNPNEEEDWEYAKKAILEVLNSQNVSLSKVRYIFDSIVKEIEEKIQLIHKGT